MKCILYKRQVIVNISTTHTHIFPDRNKIGIPYMDKSSFDLGKLCTWGLSTVDAALILEPVHILNCIYDDLL